MYDRSWPDAREWWHCAWGAGGAPLSRGGVHRDAPLATATSSRAPAASPPYRAPLPDKTSADEEDLSPNSGGCSIALPLFARCPKTTGTPTLPVMATVTSARTTREESDAESMAAAESGLVVVASRTRSAISIGHVTQLWGYSGCKSESAAVLPMPGSTGRHRG